MRAKWRKNQLNFSYFSLAVFFLLFFVLFGWLNNQMKSYQSRVYFLLIPQDQKTAIQIKSVTNNLVEIINTSLFYQKKEFTAKDKANYQKFLKAQALPGTSIITMQITTDDARSNQKIKTIATQLFLQKAAFYYNVKNELDIRIIKSEEPATFHSNYSAAGLLSFGLALGLWLLGQLLWGYLNFFMKKYSQSIKDKIDWQPLKKDFFSQENIKNDKISISSNQKKISSSQKQKKSNISFSKSNQKEKVSATRVKKSSAPSNLPTIEEDENMANHVPSNLPIAPARDNYSEKKASTTNEVNEKKNNLEETEPTEEEYKERLNQLLRGDL